MADGTRPETVDCEEEEVRIKRKIVKDDLAGSLIGLGALLRPNSKQIAFVLFLLMLLTGVNMVPPMLLGLLINKVFIEHAMAMLWLILGAYMVVFATRNMFYFYSKFAAVKIGEHVAFRLRQQLFEQLQQKSLQFYRKHNPGKISSRVMNDSFIIQSFIQDELPTLLQSLLLFVGLIAVIYAMNWQLAIVATAILPLHILAATWFKRPIKSASSEAQEHLANAQGNLIEKLLAAELVKGFTGEQRENVAFTAAIDNTRQSQIKSKKFHVRQKVVADLLIGAGTIALIGFGALHVVHGKMDSGIFMTFNGYVMMLYPNVLELMTGFAKLTRVTASIDRVFEILTTDETERMATSPIVKPIRGDIVFKNVSVAYDDREPLLRNLNIEIPAGAVCGIVGPSGSGKSTLAKLLPRFVDVHWGLLTIDGIDVQDYSLQHLRENVGMAFQDCLLFESTIIENLKYANPEATMEKIVDVAKRTGAHEIINALPNGYQTDIGGDEGVSLSRGEMQRIALARAILRDPRILVLDEATSSIDPESEAKIIPEVLEMMKGRTTLMITANRELFSLTDMVIELGDNGAKVYYKEEISERFGGGIAGRIGGNMKTMMSWMITALTIGLLGFGTPAYAQAKKAEVKPAAKPAAVQKKVEAKPAAKPTAKSPAKPVLKPVTKAAAKPAPKPAAKVLAKPTLPKPVEASKPQDTARIVHRGVGDFFPMDGVNQVELNELLDIAHSNAKSEKGYVLANEWLSRTLPSPPSGLNNEFVLAREEKNGVHLLHVGYKTYRSQSPHLYIYAQTIGNIPNTAKKELDQFVQYIQTAKTSLDKQSRTLKVRDLANELVTLSYVDADRALAVLKGLGYQCIEYPDPGPTSRTKYQVLKPSKQVDPKNLPAVVLMPAPNFVDLVGGSGVRGGAYGLSLTPSSANALQQYTNASRTMDLMVLYNPVKPEQFSEVLDRIRTTIDLPARQIYIEAMVLEISETGLKKLGVEWEIKTGTFGGELDRLKDVALGTLPNFEGTGTSHGTLNLEIDGLENQWSAKIQAMVRDGNAEILSRPSVLTLDSRQASIRVGEEIPVAKSVKGLNTNASEAFLDFSYIPVGILLNVRPRISADNEEVSMQIDGIVSSQVLGEDLVIKNSSGGVLGSAPRISTRRVQTHTRIANNTPFIIGGLVSKDQYSQVDKVPFLGDLPIIGGLFRTTDSTKKRREVIIVITPYVLPNNRVVGRNLPRDEDAFDSFDQMLFRDAYRIRAEDVFDLGFLLKNEKLRKFKELANIAVENNFQRAMDYPFNRFVGDRFPGETILVYRQMYEVLKRLKLDKNVNSEKIIFFEPDDDALAGFDVSFLWKFASGFADEVYAGYKRKPKKETDRVWGALKGKAIAITYTLQPSGKVDDVMKQPVPQVRIVDCPDRKTWSRMLYELNQLDDDDNQRHTILIQNEKDLIRLKRAILLKQIVRLNGGNDSLTLSRFAIGRQLLMPDIKEDKVYLIDEEAAKYFYLTDQYYPALKDRLDYDLKALRNALMNPEISSQINSTIPTLNDYDLMDFAPKIEK